MTDNRTTELLPCPFCGSNKAFPNIELGKHWVECSECAAESGCYRTEAEAIAAWNTRAHGTLTAEQVRECVQHVYYEGYNDGSVHRSHGIEETDWQAIADELNAETRRMNPESTGTHIMCDDCGGYIGTAEEIAEQIIHCRNCSKWHHIDTENDVRYGECDEWKRPDSCFLTVTREDGFCYCGKERTD